MSLSQKWIAFCKKKLDAWMLKFQRDSEVTLEEWNELQSSYKNLFGEKFTRKHNHE